jgi:hypothetical protein
VPDRVKLQMAGLPATPKPLFFMDFGGLNLGPPYLASRNVAEVPMPRLRLGLATLVLLIAIVALATALFVQARRETAIVKAHEQETARDRRLLERYAAEVTRQRQLNKPQAQAARPSSEGKTGDRNRPPDNGEVVGPKD